MPATSLDPDLKVVIRVRDTGKDRNNIPFTVRFGLAKLIKENRLSMSAVGSMYFLKIDNYEIGLPLPALKEIVGLALAMMPYEDVKEVLREWMEV